MGNRIEDLEIYQLSETLADEVWDMVSTWEYFAKDTVGKQMVRSADSLEQILPRALAGFIIRRIRTFVISAGAHLSKLKVGCGAVSNET